MTSFCRYFLLTCISFTLSLASHAENFTTNIINGTSLDTGDDYVVGDSGSLNFFRIQNGGSQTNFDGIVGSQSTARSNSVIITDSNSLWQNDALFVGLTGSVSQVTVTSSGRVNCVSTTIGSDVAAVSNRVLVSGPGSRLSNSQTLTVGLDGSFNQLIITNGGRVDSLNGVVGNSPAAPSAFVNSVVVTGVNSVWSNASTLFIGGSVGGSGAGSRLTIENGGRVNSVGGTVARMAASTNSVVVVTGTNSLWSNSGTLNFGAFGAGSSLTIQNGGMLSNGFAFIGFASSSSNNTVLVADSNSLWLVNGTLAVGTNSVGNQLTITNNGLVRATKAIVGVNAANNSVVLSGGTFIVSNATSNASCEVRRGTMTLNSGSLIVNQLYVSNGVSASFAFRGGTLVTRTTIVANAQAFIVGNGTNAATLNLLGGGHSFANGLTVSSNASVTGTGTIVGGVTDNGTISPGNSAGSLAISGTLTQQSAATLVIEIGGFAQGTSYDFIPVNGAAVFNGQLAVNFINGFENSVTNGASFTVLTASSGISGAFNNIASGSRLVITNGFGDVLVTYSGTSLILSDYHDIRDNDNDGIPNWWEDAFGLNKNNITDASADNDGDGLSNLQEYLAGTVPTDAASALRITAIAREGNNMRVTWTMGVGKTNALQSTTGATDGSYSNNFTDLFIVTNTVGSVTNYLDPSSALQTQRFYRIRLVP